VALILTNKFVNTWGYTSMKILVLPAFYPNSYKPLLGIFFRDHAFALQAVGHEVIVLAVVAVSWKDVWTQRKFTFGFKQQNDNGITTYIYEFPAIPKLRWLNNDIRTFIGWRLYRIIRKQHGCPNLVHLHSFSAGDLARKIKQLDKVPYAITEHSTAFARGLLSASERRLASRAFSQAIVCTAVSVEFGQLLAEQYGLPFIYTPNPVGFEETFPDIGSHVSKLERQRIRICNVAYLDVKKRQDRLIRAFNSVVRLSPDAELHIAGNGPERERLEELVSDLGLGSQVIFHGLLQRTEVFKLMCSCNIFALSSDYETFGVVLIEAMYCGLPVVATRCGGPESIVTEEWLGILTQKDDIEFSQGLLKAVEGVKSGYFDATLINAHIVRTYSYAAIGQRMTEIYSSPQIQPFISLTR
jgi:glycosyltransferase involved in cell wall biosynthesis